jgi:hypothetical protein
VADRELTPRQLDQFARDGWLLLDGLPDVTVAALQAAVDDVAAWPEHGPWLQHFEQTDGGRALARTENFTPYSDVLRAVLREGPIPDVAGQLLGEPALLYKEKINYKAPGGAGFSPHQDQPAYPFVDRVLSVMVAVDDATVQNGCLYVVSGRHQAVLPQDDRGCIRRDVVASMTWSPVELPAGATLFFHALTPHRSGPNATQLPRRALYPTYNGVSEGDLRDAYYDEKRRAFAGDADGERVRLSLIGDFEGRPA